MKISKSEIGPETKSAQLDKFNMFACYLYEQSRCCVKYLKNYITRPTISDIFYSPYNLEYIL